MPTRNSTPRKKRAATALPISLLIAGLGLVTATGCTWPSSSVHVELHEPPEEDDAYQEVTKAATRRVEVFHNFETVYQMEATYLSPDFLAAFNKRYKRIFSPYGNHFEQAAGKAGFFVSVFSPESKGDQLNNDQLWSVTMIAGGQKYEPLVIKYLSKKQRWSSFFGYITPWSREFFVLFDAPATSPGDGRLVKPTSIVLEVSNADAKTRMVWP